MSELTERLRFQSRYTQGQVPVTMCEAATRIEELEAELSKLHHAEVEDLHKSIAKNAGICVLLSRQARLERQINCYSDHAEYFGFAVKQELLPILRGETE